MKQFFFRFNVDQDLCDATDIVENAILHLVGNQVSRADAQISVDHNVKIDIVPKTDLPHKALLQPDHAGNNARYLPNMLFDVRRWRSVQNFFHGGPQLTPRIE